LGFFMVSITQLGTICIIMSQVRVLDDMYHCKQAPLLHKPIFVYLLFLFCSSYLAPTSAIPTHLSSISVITDDKATRAFDPQIEVVDTMVAKGIMHLTGAPNPSQAWLSLVSTNDTIGLKVFSLPGRIVGTRPAVVRAVVKQLLEAQVPRHQIIIWDKRLSDLRRAGFIALGRELGVPVKGALEEGYDDQNFYDTALIGRLIWGDLEFGLEVDGVGRKSFASKLMSEQITKIILISPLLNHNLIGVSGNLFSLAMGSVDNTLRFESNAENLSIAVPELFAQPLLGDRVALSIMDALISQYLGEKECLLHYSKITNQLWFGLDPLALDTYALEILKDQRKQAKIVAPKSDCDLYSNAAILELGTNDLSKIRIEQIP
jgi:hypothetical protein